MNLAKLEQSIQVQEQIDLETKHTFSPGLYIRELHIPKGVFIIGKRHRHKTMNMLIKGKMTIYDENETFEVEAPFIAESEAFTKKAGLAHEDSVWINIHATNETDLDIIEKEFIIDEEEFLQLQKEESLCLG